MGSSGKNSKFPKAEHQQTAYVTAHCGLRTTSLPVKIGEYKVKKLSLVCMKVSNFHLQEIICDMTRIVISRYKCMNNETLEMVVKSVQLVM